MRPPVIAILLLLLTLALAVPSKHVLIGKVVRVIDGDTIVVRTDDQTEERIRLWAEADAVARWEWRDGVKKL